MQTGFPEQVQEFWGLFLIFYTLFDLLTKKLRWNPPSLLQTLGFSQSHAASRNASCCRACKGLAVCQSCKRVAWNSAKEPGPRIWKIFTRFICTEAAFLDKWFHTAIKYALGWQPQYAMGPVKSSLLANLVLSLLMASISKTRLDADVGGEQGFEWWKWKWKKCACPSHFWWPSSPFAITIAFDVLENKNGNQK